MKTISKMTVGIAFATVFSSLSAGAMAETGETAVVESRAMLAAELARGKAAPQPTAHERANLLPTAHRVYSTGTSRKPGVWSDNFAAGRIHEQLDRD